MSDPELLDSRQSRGGGAIQRPSARASLFWIRDADSPRAALCFRSDWPASHLAPFTFVSSVSEAVSLALAAGDGSVGVSGPSIAQQCLNLGLLDEVRIDLVPVFLGCGVRYFSSLGTSSALLEQVEVVAGVGVTHLRYRVRYPQS